MDSSDHSTLKSEHGRTGLQRGSSSSAQAKWEVGAFQIQTQLKVITLGKAPTLRRYRATKWGISCGEARESRQRLNESVEAFDVGL